METVATGLMIPEVEVAEKPVRRRFSVEYKRKVLREADGCVGPGEVGALLRREGLFLASEDMACGPGTRGDIGAGA